MDTAQTPQATNEYKKFSKYIILTASTVAVLVSLTDAIIHILFPDIGKTFSSFIDNAFFVLVSTGGAVFVLKVFKSNIDLRMQAEDKYKRIIDNIPDAVYTADIKGITTYISPAVEKITGYTVEEFMTNKSNWFGAIHPDDVKKGAEAFEALFKSKIDFDIEYRYKRKDGKWIWVHDRSNKVYDKNGVMYADGVFGDITQKKEAEFKSHLQSQLLEAVNRAIIYTDLQGTILYWNRFAEELYGWKKEEVIGKNVIEITPSQITQDQAKEIMTRLQKGESWTGDFLVKKKDGTEFTALVTDSPFYDQIGKLKGIVGASMDISDRKKLEESLEEKSKQLEENQRSMLKLLADLSTQKTKAEQEKEKGDIILKNIGEGLIVTDGKGKIVFINRAGVALLGWILDEIINRDLAETVEAIDEHGNIIPETQRPIFITRTTGKTVVGKYFYRCKDKSIKPMMLTTSPILQNTEVVGTISIFRDITKELEIDRMKTEFVSVASHELRTPLTVIDGIVSMIRDGEYGPISEDLKQPLEDVNTSSQRLIHLVNDLLNISRIEQGKLKYKISDFSIADVITETVHLLQPIAKEKNLTLSASKIESIVVSADLDKVKEILNNLIGNAIKFTDKGNIEVTTKTKADLVEIYIKDTGIGITSVDKPRLFGKFQQIESTISKNRVAGSGLGLHISLEIVQKMGGNVWLAQSEVGKGSTFAFSVPIAKSEVAIKVKETIELEAKNNPDQKSDTITHAKS